MEKKIVVYQHRRNDTGEIFYIGIGLINRPYETINRNNWWHNIVNKNGYSIEIVKDNLSWDEACQEEKRLIKLYGRKDLGLGTLVNMTDGGEGSYGRICSEETKEKISNSKIGKVKHTEEWKNNHSKIMKGKNNPFYNKKHSEKTREKLKKINQGESNYHSKLTNEDVIFIRKNAIKGVNQFNKGNILELAKMFNVSRTIIINVVNNKVWTHI